jgi:hypothetical protein
MAPKGRLSKTWMGTCLGPKFVAAVYPIHLSSSFGKTTQSVCSLAKQSVEKLGGRTCHLWAIKLVLWFNLPFQFPNFLIKIPKTSKYLTGCFHMDSTGLFEKYYENTVSPTIVTSTLQAAVNAGTHTQWLVLVRPQGIMEVFHSITSFYIALKCCLDLDPSQIDISFLFRWIIDTSKRPPRFTRPSCFVTGPRFSS